MDVSNLVSTIVNPLVDAVIAGIAGGVIAMVLGRMKPVRCRKDRNARLSGKPLLYQPLRRFVSNR